MSIPSTFAPVSTQDFTLRAVDVHRGYAYSSSAFDTTASGYFLQEAFYRRDPTPIGTTKALNDPTNSADHSYKHVIWKSIDQRYYRFPYDQYATLEHPNKMLTDKYIYPTASVLTMPYLDFGIKIKPGSLIVSNSLENTNFYDDGLGNLKVGGWNDIVYMDKSSLVGYWGFNDLYRHFTYNTGQIERSSLVYDSRTHSVDAPSILNSVYVEEGVICHATASGLGIQFNGTSHILTPHRDELNFLDSTDWTISLWARLPSSQSVIDSPVNDLISKNGVIFKTTYGNQDSQLVEGTTLNYKHYSSSFKNESTNVYPYSLQVYNQTSANSGKILFKASNGIGQIELTSSAAINSAVYTHIAVTKSGSLYSMYIGGSSVTSGSVNLGLCANENALMFGAKNVLGHQGLSGSLDEIRIYEYAASPTEITYLWDEEGQNTLGQGMYQTSTIGNIFYRRGIVTVSTPIPAFQNVMKNAWTLKYRGTHTIFQYETLCRIRKGDFNLSMNPTARIHPKSDRLIDDFTGSLLKPYATTVGLYNDNHELMAVAKLGQPLKMRDDVDINIIVSWDS